MGFLKYAIILLATFSCAWAVSSSWGSRYYNDVLLSNEAIVRTPTANTYLMVDVVFPKSGQINNRNITAIFVYDRFTNSSGAIANLWSGGPGTRFTTASLKSQIGRGINSTVEIWGR